MKRKSFIFLCFIIVLIISLMGCSNKGNGPATNYTLNITIEGEGNVNLDPDRSSYSEGTAVDITAIPATGHVFDHWEGSGFYGEINQTINIVMDSNYSLKAVFVSDDDPVINYYTLNITIEGEGEVNLDPDRSSYSEGTSVDITAIPATGHEFDHWEGSGFYGETNETINIVMDSNYSLKAVFVSEGNTVINFADPDLEDVIRNNIDKPTGEIYESDVDEIISLTALSSNIDNLSGIEYLNNLEYLDFGNNQVSDISPLSNLTDLESLDFGDNQVSDISPLSNLTNLTHLYFGNNQVSDISPLSNLTNLTHLYFGNNQVSDISPLSNLTNLEYLGFWGNQVSDISPLSNLTNLEYLAFGYNQVSDISPLSNLTNLEILYLTYNQISSISALVDNPGINNGDLINVRYNNLNLAAGEYNNIVILQNRGVNIYYLPQN